MRKNLYEITSKYTSEKIINEEVFVRVKKKRVNPGNKEIQKKNNLATEIIRLDLDVV